MPARRKTNKNQCPELEIEVMASSLGVNPVKGGRPPIDSRANEANSVDCILFFVNIWLSVYIWLMLKIIKADSITSQYINRYVNQVLSDSSRRVVIQAICVIEEKTVILRKEVWVRPPIDPIIADKVTRVAIVVVTADIGKIKVIAIRGFIF